MKPRLAREKRNQRREKREKKKERKEKTESFCNPIKNLSWSDLAENLTGDRGHGVLHFVRFDFGLEPPTYNFRGCIIVPPFWIDTSRDKLLFPLCELIIGFLSGNRVLSHQEANCARCGELMSYPSFRFTECEFCLHKKCAEAPSQILHPFHRTHPLDLLQKPPYPYPKANCNFCGENCELFVYHCSCELDFHIKCALFSLHIAENKLGELENVAIKDPLVSTEDGNNEVESSLCFVCREPLSASPYFSLDCGFNLHKKCAEFPHEINHPFHKSHPLILQFSPRGERFSL
ncbi:hypothetical protein PTKIN_Ptkin09bG0047000 [Pterospermum kingtungense]